MTRAEHVKAWQALWKQARGLHVPISGPRKAKHEALELLSGALIYHRNALEAFGKHLLHQRLRVRRKFTKPDPVLTRKTKLRFSSLKGSNAMLGHMHLASASLRLPMAMIKTVETLTDFPAVFKTAAGAVMTNDHRDDWLRSKWFNYVNSLGPSVRLERLKCCRGNSLGADNDHSVRTALAIVLLHRDDYAHGEIARRAGARDWLVYRTKWLDQLYRCRIAQAQRELIAWGLTKLG